MSPKSSAQSDDNSDVAPATLRRSARLSRASSREIKFKQSDDEEEDDMLSSAESGEIISISSGEQDTDDNIQQEVQIIEDDNEQQNDDGEDREDGEVDPNADRKQIASQISKDLSTAQPAILQKNARYFMLSNVVCSKCGTKGHLSYDCPEEDIEERCFLCGGIGHTSRSCPAESCYVCGGSGHRAKDCTSNGWKNKRVIKKRDIPPPRETRLQCYVCGKNGHLDCSLRRIATANLSCHNCGQPGHTGNGCRFPNADKMIPVAMDMDRVYREKRKRKQKGRGKKKRMKHESFDETNDDGDEDLSDDNQYDEIKNGVELRDFLLRNVTSRPSRRIRNRER